MKTYILLGLAAASLFALAPRESKAAEFRVYVEPGYQQDKPYYYREYYRHYGHYRHSDELYWHRWHRNQHHYDYTGITTIGINNYY